MDWYWILAIVIGAVAVLLVLSVLFYKQFFKRFYDIVLSGMALLILSPLLIVLTIVGAIAMHGNPFFVQPRPGKIDPKTGKEKIFNLVKFRTMTNLKDKDGNLLPDEKRLTKYGKMLRRTSLDELPELINILIGQMSIVGPRPLRVYYLPWYTEEEKCRHDVRPGLTGWAQVNGRNTVGWDERLAYDVEYVSNISFSFDMKIIILTVKLVLVRSGVEVDTADEGRLDVIRKAKIERGNDK